MAKARVLVVDDSAFMRKVISDMIATEDTFAVIGTARDGLDALNKIEKLQPDIITLDVEMPRKDGLSTLREIMAKRPVPVIMLSSLTQTGAKATMEALALGAVDFVAKPSGSISLDIADIQDELIQKLKAAVGAKVQTARTARPTALSRWPASSSTTPTKTPTPMSVRAAAEVSIPPRFPLGKKSALANTVIVIGSSTGGPRALEEVLRQFPKDLSAGVLIVQHMPAGFTKSMAERLDQVAALEVREAEDGDEVKAGAVYIAPGGYHMTVSKERIIKLDKGPQVNYVRPSIDVTMLKLPEVYGNRLVGVILTGMGKDGAEGMAKIKQAGGVTIVQDEYTSTIYSMPRAVVETGNADFILPIGRVGDAAVRAARKLE
ncbi:MAG: chemotaxis response regulator protein-glutamate methylesterase [Firmicutes bacterium]|nr:chemotaxis response regulator protein-glutamate methylesterase [Bacillota bacterium]